MRYALLTTSYGPWVGAGLVPALPGMIGIPREIGDYRAPTRDAPTNPHGYDPPDQEKPLAEYPLIKNRARSRILLPKA